MSCVGCLWQLARKGVKLLHFLRIGVGIDDRLRGLAGPAARQGEKLDCREIR
jgi:hypothetical protein